MPQVFISYSRRDALFAYQLADALAGAGVQVWIDKQNIQPGAEWSNVIQKALDDSEVMLLIVTPDSMASSNVQDEWQYYQAKKKKIIPILWIATNIHFQLIRLQYIDFSQEPFEVALTQLLSHLGIEQAETIIAGKRGYDTLRRKYEDWIAFGRDDHQLLELNMITFIVQQATRALITPDLMEYLLCSVVQAQDLKGFDQSIEGLKAWLDDFDRSRAVEVLNHLLDHPNSAIRRGILNLIKRLHIEFAADLILTRLDLTQNVEILKTALNTLDALDRHLPESQAKQLFENSDNWIVQSLTLKSHKPGKAALLISDGTMFCDEFGEMARTAGFTLVTLGADSRMDWKLNTFRDDFLNVYDLVIVVRGEHARVIGGDEMYDLLEKFVEAGGALFATPWVGWETKAEKFAGILPFLHKGFLEDETLTCRPTQNELAQALFSPQARYVTSYEVSEVRPESTLLAETANGIPVFGYRKLESGICYYLNVCQHSCMRKPLSPFSLSPELHDSLQRVLNWIYSGSA